MDRPFTLLPENQAFLDRKAQLRLDWAYDRIKLPPWFFACRVKVLIVTDGGHDFSAGDFGLSTFVTTLLNSFNPARFQISLGHLEDRSGDAMMGFEPRILERIPMFEFDNPAHFLPEKYDVVFLFGIRPVLQRLDANGNVRLASNGQPYPSGSLAQPELHAIATFQNGGGGLFATGDHGALGRFMGQALPRAGRMRLWDSTSGDPLFDEVSMGGPRRNDTNRLGDAGSQFDDQSDDIPQTISPRIYTARNGLFRYSYPHPLLCGPNGPISVMPDHPHEGECIEAADPDQDIGFPTPLGPEFPPATDGGPRPLPEVISTNSVLSGTTSGGKAGTVAHSFGGISAYDGHRAGIGRVATDATWHHFVNINLVGEEFLPDNSVKGMGFLASPTGQAHFEAIKAYFRNLGIWLSRPANLRCMNRHIITQLLRTERVMEAVLTTPHVRLDGLSVSTFWLIGRHARDAMGKYASQCQSQRLILDLLFPEYRHRIPEIDPWRTRFTPEEMKERGLGPVLRAEEAVNWINTGSLMDIALGAALVAVNQNVDFERGKVDEDAVVKQAAKGARHGLKLGLADLSRCMDDLKSVDFG